MQRGYRPESSSAWPGFFCLRVWWEGKALDREVRSWNSAPRQSLAARRRQTGLFVWPLTIGDGLVGARGFEPPTPCAQGLVSRGINELAPFAWSEIRLYLYGFLTAYPMAT